MLVEVISTVGDISSLPVEYLNFLELKRIFFTSVFVYKPTKKPVQINSEQAFCINDDSDGSYIYSYDVATNYQLHLQLYGYFFWQRPQFHCIDDE